jgi:hypothetical protein
MSRKRISLLAIALGIACVLPAIAETRTPLPDPASVLRVGTYDAGLLVVAYYRDSNPYLCRENEARRAEFANALKSGDREAIARLEKRLAQGPERARQQALGQAPIDNILDALKAVLPGVARTAHVSLIVPEVLYRTEDVEIVDVTDLLLEHFVPDQKTRENIRNLEGGAAANPPR